MIVRPSVLVIYREDHKFLLDGGDPEARPDLRALRPGDRLAALAGAHGREFKVQKVLAPLARSLAPGAGCSRSSPTGRDPGLEIIQQLWPEERPFQVDRHELLAALRRELGRDARDFSLTALAG